MLLRNVEPNKIFNKKLKKGLNRITSSLVFLKISLKVHSQ